MIDRLPSFRPLLISLLGLFMAVGGGVTARADEQICEETLITNGSAINELLEQVRQVPAETLLAQIEIIEAVDNVCPIGEPGLCSPNDVEEALAYEIASGRHGIGAKPLVEVWAMPNSAGQRAWVTAAWLGIKSKQALKTFFRTRLGLFIRRSSLAATWLTTIIGPAYYTAEHTKDLKPLVSGILVILVAKASGYFTDYLGTPFWSEGWRISRFAMNWFGASAVDEWGKSMSAMDEKDRTVAELLAGLFIAEDPYFDRANGHLKNQKLDLAAEAYLDAILQVHYLFRGANLIHKANVKRVRDKLKDVGRRLSPAEVTKLKRLILVGFLRLDDKLIPERYTRETLLVSVLETINLWFEEPSAG